MLLIPKSNPFLRQLFSYVAGPELDERVVWIVDALCEVFLFSDLDEILKDFGNSTGQSDPILHFYETFLAEYDKSLRKSRGVWYTPEPVVNFIVRAIDEVLKTHFNLKNGIADKSKIKIEVEDQSFDEVSKPNLAKKDIQVHKVQLLDVATGTGTFLAEAVKQIYKHFKGQEGIWSSYVENELLPRLHGFELLMASYAMCHMKLDLLLQETGYKPSNTITPPRLSVYLTNSLEEHHPEMDTLFASWLSKEANEASWIKKNMPIMVAFGNPPYSGHSSNNGEWIVNLIDDYKQEPSGGRLQEKNPKWLNDDYVKFLRLGEYYIEKNCQGILAYITNNSYLDNPTFRGMRYHLLKTFDDIYIVDLHGSSKKKEIAPDGSKDVNVFDIQTGVSIIVAVKNPVTEDKKLMAQVHHIDKWGGRQEKYDFLNEASFENIKFKKLNPSSPFYMFIPRNEVLLKEYNEFIIIDDLMTINVLGFQTHRDKFAVAFDKADIKSRIEDLRNNDIDDVSIIKKYSLKENKHWQLLNVRKKLRIEDAYEKYIIKSDYRLFDKRWCYFHTTIMDRPRTELTEHVANKENVCLLVSRQQSTIGFHHVWVANEVANDCVISNKSRESNYVFPLYLYQENMGVEIKVPNLNPKIYTDIKSVIPDITPESLFDYIYAVLHCQLYRTRYAEFLKSDFPRIPYPSTPEAFHMLAGKGAELRELHLMESDSLDELITTYPKSGDNEVVKPRFEKGMVWINEVQYFGNVPAGAWEFYIGGYQPAQKWLKDRMGRTLSVDDIMHYQRVIVALVETGRLMKEIDEIDFLPK